MLQSCSSSPYFEEYIGLRDSTWHSDSVATFTVEIEDTASEFLIGINLRNNNDYPYSNIFLFREIRSSRGIEFRDTMEFFLADSYGKWLGDGVGELKTNQWQFASKGLRFRKKDTYTFSFNQAMREDELKGVEDIGITIFRNEKE